MSILPTWPIAAGALVVGILGGAYVDHKVMQGRIDKITMEHAEELRLREVKRSEDERAARYREQLLSEKVGQIEEDKQNEITRVSTDAAALIARLRNQAASKPARPSPVSGAAPSCEVAAGPVVSERVGVDLVSLAQRADEMRAALGACYKAYDSISAAQ